MRAIVVRFTVAIVVLIASLSLVAARQGKGMRVFAEVERLQDQIALERASEDELVAEVRRLESRTVVEGRAASELGMHIPVGPELRFFGEEER